MNKVIVICCSMTGNTEEMAEEIVAGIRHAGVEPAVRDIMDAKASELEEYDVILIGAYTWGDGELPDEFLDFYEELDGVKLQGKLAAVFGSGDSSYPIYCGAVDLIEEKLKERGAQIAAPGLKVEFNPSDEEKEQCRDIGRKMAAAT
ncbi:MULTISPECIES: flavodoxin [Paenibacillus]|uniref:flavodoxin n=1 Tax=Paenibacillus TaxID=44249 RepID=UPI000432AD21|nr:MULTISPECIES: flavodoxin [Paenibacillus]CDN45623.1 Probable flavodoxin-2 [Paenibacillus sp. P22]